MEEKIVLNGKMSNSFQKRKTNFFFFLMEKKGRILVKMEIYFFVFCFFFYRENEIYIFKGRVIT